MKLKEIDDNNSRVIVNGRPTKFIVRRALLSVEAIAKGSRTFGYVIEREDDLTKQPIQIDEYPYTTKPSALHAVWKRMQSNA